MEFLDSDALEGKIGKIGFLTTNVLSKFTYSTGSTGFDDIAKSGKLLADNTQFKFGPEGVFVGTMVGFKTKGFGLKYIDILEVQLEDMGDKIRLGLKHIDASGPDTVSMVGLKKKCEKDAESILKHLAAKGVTNVNRAKSEAGLAFEAHAERVAQEVRKLSATAQLLGALEIAELPSIVRQDETIYGMCQGKVLNAQGLLVATSSRVIFIDKSVASLKVQDIAYPTITAVQHAKAFAQGELVINTAGPGFSIRDVANAQIDPMVAAINRGLAEARQPQRAASTSAVDVAEQLTKLAKLKEQGILTEEEFASQKAKLLAL